MAWRAKDAIQHQLATRHRERLDALKVRGAEELAKRGTLDWLNYNDDRINFSIEIDAEKRRFSDIYRDPVLVARFNHQELTRLCRNFRSWCYVAAIFFVTSRLFSRRWVVDKEI